MTYDNGQRIATADGAVLTDPTQLGDWRGPTPGAPLEALFEPSFWAGRGELAEVTLGRGSAWFIGADGRWVLRHSRRGGFVARWSRDRYLWAGERRVRAFAEWRLLDLLSRRGLPVPTPIAARYRRAGAVYRCDLITQRIAGARPLSTVLSCGPLDERTWRHVGAAVGRLHAAGVDHADLNAHNILLDGAGRASVIDFDRGRLRSPGAWAARNMARLQRSLAKVARELPPDRFSAAAWNCLLDGYARTGHVS
jgi:tRNA A-37 threonylcarbamoyl transferase component Bud32